jgi:hypothetical protein
VTGILNPSQTLDNAEIDLIFSTTDVFDTCAMLIFDTIGKSKALLYFKCKDIPNISSVLSFDGHCTHIQRHAGKF